MRKALAISVALLLSASLAFASGEQEQEEEGGPQEITFWTISLEATFSDYIEGLIDEFEEMHDDVTVEWVDVPIGDMETRITTAAASGDMPDVVNLNPEFAQQLAEYGVLADMNEYASDVKDDFYSGTWEASELDGVAFGLPWYITASVMFYNEELFEEAGLPVESPETFEEALETARTIHEETGAYGYMTILSEQFIMEELEKMGIRLFNEDYTEAQFATDEVLEMVDTYAGLIEDGVMPQDALTEGAGEAIQLYSSGELAMFQGGTSQAGMIEENSESVYDVTGVGPQPISEGGKSNIAVMNVGVAEESQYRDTAIEFAKFVTNFDNQLAFAEEAGTIIPPNRGATDESFFQADGSDDANTQARVESAEQIPDGEVIFRPVSNWGEIRDAFIEAFGQAVAGDGDPEELLEEAEEIANGYLEE
ncbi:MAG: ABC transporter substrate-binding protein [Spirochaetales bacterium]